MKIKSDIYKWNSTVLLFRSCLRSCVGKVHRSLANNPTNLCRQSVTDLICFILSTTYTFRILLYIRKNCNEKDDLFAMLLSLATRHLLK